MSDMYQNAILTLSDGRRVVYTGKVQIQDRENLKLIKIEVTRPKELPQGCKFTDIEGGGNERIC